MNDDLRRELEAAGRRPVPDPRPEFQAALEARLLAVARTAAPAAPPAPPARVRRWPAFRLAAGLTAAAAMLLIVVLIGVVGVGTSPDLELTGAVNVEVALADGTTLMNPDGLLLPDGSVVRVGAGGSARVGDVVLRGGDVATIDAGRLQVQPGSEASRPGGSTLPTVPPGASAPPASRTPTPSTPVTSPTPSPAPTTRSGEPPNRLPTATPDRTPPATATPSATPTATRTGSPSTATPRPQTPTPTPADVATIKLVARVAGPSEVKVTWTGTPGALRYRLVAWVWRAGDEADPAPSARKVIGEFTRPPDSPLVFRVGTDVVRVRLQVVAFAADGTRLAHSNFARVSFAR